MGMWIKALCRHLYGLFNSAPRLGNYIFLSKHQIITATWQCDCRGRSWRKILAHHRLGIKDLASMLSPLNLTSLRLMFLKQVHDTCAWHIVGYKELSKSRLPWLILELPMAPSSRGPDLCSVCCTKKEAKPPMQPLLN